MEITSNFCKSLFLKFPDWTNVSEEWYINYIDSIAILAEQEGQNRDILDSKVSELSSIADIDSLETLTEMKINRGIRDNDNFEQMWDIIHELFAWKYLKDHLPQEQILFVPKEKKHTSDIQVGNLLYEVKRVRKSMDAEREEFMNLKNRTANYWLRSDNTVRIEQQKKIKLEEKITNTVKKALKQNPDILILFVSVDFECEFYDIDIEEIVRNISLQNNTEIILGVTRGSKITYSNFN